MDDYPDEPTLYERLGGIFPIAAVVDRFSDRLLENAIVGHSSKNPYLRQWALNKAPERLAGLKWMRTLWLADVSGGPYRYVPTRPGRNMLSLEVAHCPLHISSDEFDAVAHELGATLDEFQVPAREKNEVLAAFANHKREVILGSKIPPAYCPVHHVHCS